MRAATAASKRGAGSPVWAVRTPSLPLRLRLCKGHFLRKAVVGYCQGRNPSERPIRPLMSLDEPRSERLE